MSVMSATKKMATYADLESVPEHLVAEIIDGALETHHHGRPRLAAARASLTSDPDIRQDYLKLLLPELPIGDHILVPDMAAWRHKRVRPAPQNYADFPPPDWICEVFDEQTVRLDRGAKRRIYGEFGVRHLWLLDTDNRILESYENKPQGWTLAGVATGSEDVSLPPFDAISFSLDVLFPLDSPEPKPQG